MSSENEEMKNAPEALPDAPKEAAEPQEEALFQNSFVPGYEEFLQASQRVLKKNTRIPAPLLWVWVGLMVFLAAYNLIGGEGSIALSAGLIALAGLLAFMYVGMPRLQAKMTVRQLQEAYQEPVALDTFFYKNALKIYNHASKGEMRFAYKNIAACMETESLYLLQSREKQTAMLLKAGFSGTDERGFRDFMRQKAQNAKFYWK